MKVERSIRFGKRCGLLGVGLGWRGGEWGMEGREDAWRTIEVV